MIDASDEQPRTDGDRFVFEFWSPRASLMGYIGLLRLPADQTVWYGTALFREAAPVVTLCDAFRLGRTLELRGDGLWADHNVETPLEHWSVGLEAFALALDDPTDERGIRVPLGYDLEWELDAASIGHLDSGYEQPARVHGEVLVGVDAYELDGFGWRHHGDGRLQPERRRHGLRGGVPVWTHLDDERRSGDGDLGWAGFRTPVGTWCCEPWRTADGAGFTEHGTPA